MIQFYLLSVLLNLLAGFYMLFSAHDTENAVPQPFEQNTRRGKVNDDGYDRIGDFRRNGRHRVHKSFARLQYAEKYRREQNTDGRRSAE